MQFAPAGCSFKQFVHYAIGIQNPGINLHYKLINEWFHEHSYSSYQTNI